MFKGFAGVTSVQLMDKDEVGPSFLEIKQEFNCFMKQTVLSACA